jgi:hypothetical protein
MAFKVGNLEAPVRTSSLGAVHIYNVLGLAPAHRSAVLLSMQDPLDYLTVHDTSHLLVHTS